MQKTMKIAGYNILKSFWILQSWQESKEYRKIAMAMFLNSHYEKGSGIQVEEAYI